MACSGMTLVGQGKGLFSLLALPLARRTTFCMRQCSLQKKSKTEPKPAGKTDRCTECSCDERMGNQPLEFRHTQTHTNASSLYCALDQGERKQLKAKAHKPAPRILALLGLTLPRPPLPTKQTHRHNGPQTKQPQFGGSSIAIHLIEHCRTAGHLRFIFSIAVEEK